MNRPPLEIDPPSPMPTPPLRRRPSPTPQLNFVPKEDPSQRLFIDENWN